jgi:hypothetical protein
MPLDTYVKDKSLALPEIKADEAQQKVVVDLFLTDTLYQHLKAVQVTDAYLEADIVLENGHIPSYAHSPHLEAWLRSPYRFQMDALIQRFGALLETNQIDVLDPETNREVYGFQTFHQRFFCCHSMGQHDIPPRPDPFAQYLSTTDSVIDDATLKRAEGFYQEIKEMLEKICYLFIHDKSLSKVKIKQLLTFLNKQMGQCGPGIYSSLQTVYKELTGKNGIEHWLEEYRDEIVREYAASHIHQRRVGSSYHAHVHSEYQRMTLAFNFPILKAQSLSENVLDIFTEGAKISPKDKSLFKKAIYEKYHRQAIIEIITLNIRLQFIALKGTDLAEPEELEKFSTLAQPFMDHDIFTLDECFLDDDYILGDHFFEKLPSFCEALLIKQAYIHALYPKILLDLATDFKTQAKKILGSQIGAFSDLIQTFESDIKVIAEITGLTDEQKGQAVFHLIEDCLHTLKKRPLSLKFANFFHIKQEKLTLYKALKKIKKRFIQTQNFCDSTTARETYETHQPSFLAHKSTKARNQRIVTLSTERLDSFSEYLDLDKQFALHLVYCRDEFGRDAMHFDERTDNELLVEEGKSITIDMLDEHFMFEGDHALPSLVSSLRRKMESGMELAELKPIESSSLCLLTLNIAINLKRIIKIASTHHNILNDSWLSQRGIDILCQFHPLLLSLTGLKALQFLNPVQLDQESIHLINDFVLESGINEGTLSRLSLLFENDIPLESLPVIQRLAPAYFSKKGVSLFDELLPSDISPDLIARLNELYEEFSANTIERLCYLQSNFDLLTPELSLLLTLPRYFYEIEEGMSILKSMTPTNEENIALLKSAFTYYRSEHPMAPTPTNMLKTTKEAISILNKLLAEGVPFNKLHLCIMLGEAFYQDSKTIIFLKTYADSLTFRSCEALNNYSEKGGCLSQLECALHSASMDLSVLIDLEDALITPTTLHQLFKQPIWLEKEGKILLAKLMPLIEKEGGLDFIINKSPTVINANLSALLLAVEKSLTIAQIEMLFKANLLSLEDESSWYAHLDAVTPHPFGVTEEWRAEPSPVDSICFFFFKEEISNEAVKLEDIPRALRVRDATTDI